MNLTEARETALALMTEHSLSSAWTFEFDNAQRRLGACHYGDKRITISRYMVAAATGDEVRQTMLHEIAHALIHPRHNHNDVWKAKAASIGYTGKRTSSNPYKKPTDTARGVRPFIVETNYVARAGDTVRLRNGLEGVVTKVARTRTHVLCEDGHTWTVPFGLLNQIVSTTNAASATIIDLPRKRRGDTVTFLRGKGYVGKTAIVLSVGSARYKVKVDGSDVVLFAPFTLVA